MAKVNENVHYCMNEIAIALLLHTGMSQPKVLNIRDIMTFELLVQHQYQINSSLKGEKIYMTSRIKMSL